MKGFQEHGSPEVFLPSALTLETPNEAGHEGKQYNYQTFLAYLDFALATGLTRVCFDLSVGLGSIAARRRSRLGRGTLHRLLESAAERRSLCGAFGCLREPRHPDWEILAGRWDTKIREVRIRCDGSIVKLLGVDGAPRGVVDVK